jgi:integrase
VHGFRSTFRVWAQERTNYAWETAEMALGHSVGTRVERAYARGDGLEKRDGLMRAWAYFLEHPATASPGNVVVPIRATAV